MCPHHPKQIVLQPTVLPKEPVQPDLLDNIRLPAKNLCCQTKCVTSDSDYMHYIISNYINNIYTVLSSHIFVYNVFHFTFNPYNLDLVWLKFQGAGPNVQQTLGTTGHFQKHCHKAQNNPNTDYL